MKGEQMKKQKLNYYVVYPCGRFKAVKEFGEPLEALFFMMENGGKMYTVDESNIVFPDEKEHTKAASRCTPLAAKGAEK